jgi:hypothetical protein
MREVVIQSWCDECAAAGEDVVGDPFDLPWQGRDYSLDLCEAHAGPFFEVQRLIDAYGQAGPRRGRPKKDAPAARAERREPSPERGKFSPDTLTALRQDGTYQCPSCERAFANPQGLGSHRAKSHGHRKVS